MPAAARACSLAFCQIPAAAPCRGGSDAGWRNRRRRTDGDRCCGRRHSPRCRRWRVQRRAGWTASDTSGVRPMATTTMSAATVPASCKVMRKRAWRRTAASARLAVAAGNARAQAQVHAGVAGAFGQPVRQCLGQHALQQARRAFQDGDFGPQRTRGGRHFQARKPPPMTATRVWGARPAQRGGVVQRADVMHAGGVAAAGVRAPARRSPAGSAGRSRPSAVGNAAAGVDAHDLGAVSSVMRWRS